MPREISREMSRGRRGISLYHHLRSPSKQTAVQVSQRTNLQGLTFTFGHTHPLQSQRVNLRNPSLPAQPRITFTYADSPGYKALANEIKYSQVSEPKIFVREVPKRPSSQTQKRQPFAYNPQELQPQIQPTNYQKNKNLNFTSFARPVNVSIIQNTAPKKEKPIIRFKAETEKDSATPLPVAFTPSPLQAASALSTPRVAALNSQSLGFTTAYFPASSQRLAQKQQPGSPIGKMNAFARPPVSLPETNRINNHFQPKSGRDPRKIKDIEQRLMEIIRICDEKLE